MSDDREGGGFKVTDRRRFAGDGDPGDDVQADVDAPPAGHGAPADRATVTFASFIMGLSTQTLMHLGEISDASADPPTRDLVAAQHLIDILAVLKTKTTGNLSAEESGLLDAMLYDLRIRYVTIAKHPGNDPGKETP
jgi:hypothetical protein